MRKLPLLTHSEGSLLSEFASRMSEQLIRQRANLEVRAARAQAENAIRARSEFLANMNHELRTPLNAIIGFATMLHENEYDLGEEQRSEYAQYILQSADLLLGHINTILEVAALESGGVELQYDELDFAQALTESISRAQVRADAAGVTLLRRDKSDAVIAWGDAVRASQAIDHILQAAIDSCEQGGRVLLRASFDDKGRPEIAIRDEGAGMSNDALAKTLDAFSETHRGLDKAFAGPGVGYAIAKTFMELQGGHFFAKSREGKGTLVRLILPTPEAARATPPPEQTSTMENTHAA